MADNPNIDPATSPSNGLGSADKTRSPRIRLYESAAVCSNAQARQVMNPSNLVTPDKVETRARQASATQSHM
jgi:hypothetical protein